MLSVHQTLRVSLALASVILGGHSTAIGAPISIGPALTLSLTTQHAFQTDYEAWLVSDLSDPLAPAPLQLSTGSNTGYWLQQLTFGTGFPELETGDTFFVQELLTVGGEFAPIAWSQELTTSGWKWTEAVIFDNDTAAPLPGLVVTTTDQVVSFTFDAPPIGTDLFIIKALEYTGPNGPAASPIDVKVQAVPEPGSFGIMLVGLASFALIRPRFRSLRAEAQR